MDTIIFYTTSTIEYTCSKCENSATSYRLHPIRNSSKRSGLDIPQQDESEDCISWSSSTSKKYSLGEASQEAGKELLEQKLLMLEHKTSTEAKLEEAKEALREAKIREDNLIKSNEEFKLEMKNQR